MSSFGFLRPAPELFMARHRSHFATQLFVRTLARIGHKALGSTRAFARGITPTSRGIERRPAEEDQRCFFKPLGWRAQKRRGKHCPIHDAPAVTFVTACYAFVTDQTLISSNVDGLCYACYGSRHPSFINRTPLQRFNASTLQPPLAVAPPLRLVGATCCTSNLNFVQ
jgi:hypothetical protein